jgi:pyrroloquinoline quinone biosynthesis protein D
MTEIADAARPYLPRGVRLTHDKARDRWLLLAPERVIELDDIALAILRLCDGATPLSDIADRLAETYTADRAEILADVREMLADLSKRSFVAL